MTEAKFVVVALHIDELTAVVIRWNWLAGKRDPLGRHRGESAPSNPDVTLGTSRCLGKYPRELWGRKRTLSDVNKPMVSRPGWG